MKFLQLLKSERISLDYRRGLSECQADAEAMHNLADAYPALAKQLHHEAAELMKNCRTYWTAIQDELAWREQQ